MSYAGNLGFLFYKQYFSQYNYKDEKISFDNLKKHNEDLLDFQYDADVDRMFISGEHNFILETIYPGLLIGSGYLHNAQQDEAFKIGFFFDHTTGLPVIPGSSVKGVLRSAFPGDDNNQQKAQYLKEIMNKIGIELNKKNDELVHLLWRLEYEIFEGADDISDDKIKVEKYKPIYKRDIFFEAYISEANSDNKIFGEDTLNPHGDDPLKNPTPIKFLKILPEVKFKFNFSLQDSKVLNDLTSDKKLELFKNILLDLGAGAKTNVGYGQFKFKIPKKKLPEVKITQELARELKKDKTFICKVSALVDEYYYFEFEDYPESIIRKKKDSATKKLEKKGIKELNEGDRVKIRINKTYEFDGNLNYTITELLK